LAIVYAARRATCSLGHTMQREQVVSMKRHSAVTLSLLLVLLPLVPRLANAAEWIEYFENTKGVKFYIDELSHIRVANGNTQAWQKREKEKDDGLLYLLEVNCNERKYFIRQMSAVRKTADNLKIIAASADWYLEWMHFEPNEFDEETHAVWCKLPRKR
jgi:hypothetical protein